MGLGRVGLLVFLALVLGGGVEGKGEKESGKPFVNFVLLGATGDLSAKYLWKGLYALHQQDIPNLNFRIYGTARAPPGPGRRKIREYIDRIPCEGSQCAHLKDFSDSIEYFQLKTTDQWTSICQKLNATGGKDGTLEQSRIFYLAIPPFAYDFVAHQIHRQCRPANPSASLRVAFEKPFGHNYNSAQTLAKQLKELFLENEMLHVDHYLGKPVIRDLLEIRRQNPNLFNRRHVKRVDIVVREAIDVKGRTNFYNSVGVIRDVLQVTFLSSLKPLNPSQMVLAGRYQGYDSHVHSENGGPPYMPTFASAALTISDPQSSWYGVPFVLTSGKSTGLRESYIRVTLFPDRENAEKKADALHHWYGRMEIQGKSWRREAEDSWKFHGPAKPYDHLIQALISGNRASFAQTSSLLASCRVWDSNISASEISPQNSLYLYQPQDLTESVISITEDGILQLQRKSSASRSLHDGFYQPQDLTESVISITEDGILQLQRKSAASRSLHDGL
ncbi:hypothetical protein AAMO2058_000944400 [Amorphochlora amoebiformis]